MASDELVVVIVRVVNVLVWSGGWELGEARVAGRRRVITFTTHYSLLAIK